VSPRLRLYLMRVWLDRKVDALYAWRARHSSRRMRRAFLVRLAVDATAPDLLGPGAYHGPDGVDYERMWWAIDGMLPPDRADEIRKPVYD
jgi:hypothetical protein